QCAGTRLNDSRKCSIDFAYGLRIQGQELTPEFACGGRQLFFLPFETRSSGIAIRRECRQPIELVLRPAKFNRDVVAVDEPGFLQAVAECRYPVNGMGSRAGIKETDHRY